MAKKHGIVLTFKTGTPKAAVQAALRALEDIVDPKVTWVKGKGLTPVKLEDAAEEYDDIFGSPVFYIP